MTRVHGWGSGPLGRAFFRRTAEGNDPRCRSHAEAYCNETKRLTGAGHRPVPHLSPSAEVTG